MDFKASFFVLWFCTTPFLFAQTDLINPSFSDEQQDIQLRVTAYKQNYTVDETIPVKITVKNISTEPRTITSLPEPALSYDIRILDSDRNLVERKGAFQEYMRHSVKDLLKNDRMVTLYPGEEFSVTVDLNLWYSLTNMGRYLVQVVFKDKESGQQVFSNPLHINLRPSARIIARLQIEEQLEEEERLTTMTPEGIVEFLLNAMKEKDWESHFKYIEQEKYVKAFAPFGREFDEAKTPEDREAVLARFRAWYTKVPEYNNLERFKIQNIVFQNDPRERIVYCYVAYSKKMRSNDFLYTFYLRQKGNKWYLTNVESFITSRAEWGTFDKSQIKIRDEAVSPQKR
jgi:hypothetical protein